MQAQEHILFLLLLPRQRPVKTINIHDLIICILLLLLRIINMPLTYLKSELPLISLITTDVSMSRDMQISNRKTRIYFDIFWSFYSQITNFTLSSNAAKDR